MLMVSVRGFEGELVSINPADYVGYTDTTMYDVKIKVLYDTFVYACAVSESEIKIYKIDHECRVN